MTTTALMRPKNQFELTVASARFVGSRFHRRDTSRRQVIWDAPESAIQLWERLERELFSLMDYSGALMAYLRANSDEVLAPERGLTTR